MKQLSNIAWLPGKELVEKVLKIGSWRNDVDGFLYVKNDRLRKKAGFSQENFEKIYQEKNLDGKLVYQLTSDTINFFRWQLTHCSRGMITESKEMGRISDYLLARLNYYLDTGDGEITAKEHERVLNAYMTYSLDWGEVKL